VDRVAGTTGHFHVEDALLTLFVVTQSIETANFAEDGRNLTYESRNHVLLGLVSFSSGHRIRNTGAYGRTSSFSFLWGLFGMERTLHGRTWKVFWFPIVSGDEVPEVEPDAWGPVPGSPGAAGTLPDSSPGQAPER
jgi:hypothetical protein